MEPKQQQQQQQQQPPPPQYPPPQAMAPVTYPAMTPTNKPPTFRRIIVRHTLFKAGVGGLFLSTLLFIVGFSVPAWTDRRGLWRNCMFPTCFGNVGGGPGESVSLCVVTRTSLSSDSDRAPAVVFPHLFLSAKEVRAKLQQAIGPHEGLLTIVKRRKLQWYGHVCRSSGLAKAILQSTMKGEKDKADKGRSGKATPGNRQAWSSEFARSQRAVDNRENGGNWSRNDLWCPNDPRG